MKEAQRGVPSFSAPFFAFIAIGQACDTLGLGRGRTHTHTHTPKHSPVELYVHPASIGRCSHTSGRVRVEWGRRMGRFDSAECGDFPSLVQGSRTLQMVDICVRSHVKCLHLLNSVCTGSLARTAPFVNIDRRPFTVELAANSYHYYPSYSFVPIRAQPKLACTSGNQQHHSHYLLRGSYSAIAAAELVSSRPVAKQLYDDSRLFLSRHTPIDHDFWPAIDGASTRMRWRSPPFQSGHDVLSFLHLITELVRTGQHSYNPF
ncbi:unnamed protein product [Protopolystoma xenopodis]|uniref:Uncharacterized protein n=1 Tax=Protopolystoma xenopodis TaxID=117903 RepID=A0A3S5C7G8_9PLAT|nr:unnamed protein product [Protopolystoma xenopodis]